MRLDVKFPYMLVPVQALGLNFLPSILGGLTDAKKAEKVSQGSFTPRHTATYAAMAAESAQVAR
jgi:hypothetical protein